MTDKVQKIREEVARIHNLLPVMDGDNISVNYADRICTTLEMYIDSLQEEPVSDVWHNASEEPERENLLIETNDGRIIHRQSINNYGTVKKWAYTSDLLNLDNSCNFGKNSQEEPVSIWHDANQQPTMYRKYLVRYSDGRVSGSWERHDDGFIPWKDVVKEHGFTHWCYVEDLIKL